MKHLIENTFLLILIIIGGAGITLSFTSTAEFGKESSESVVMANTKIDNRNDSENAWDTFLNIKGLQEAGSTMQFEVKSFNSNAHYLIDFGNGEKKALKNKKQHYTYRKAGNFNLKLYITYNGKTKLVHSETLNIDNQVVASTGVPHPN